MPDNHHASLCLAGLGDGSKRALLGLLAAGRRQAVQAPTQQAGMREVVEVEEVWPGTEGVAEEVWPGIERVAEELWPGTEGVGGEEWPGLEGGQAKGDQVGGGSQLQGPAAGERSKPRAGARGAGAGAGLGAVAGARGAGASLPATHPAPAAAQQLFMPDLSGTTLLRLEPARILNELACNPKPRSASVSASASAFVSVPFGLCQWHTGYEGTKWYLFL